MILFIFEGKRREVRFYNALKRVYWGKEEIIVSVFDCNIDALYHDMEDLGEGADVVELMMGRYRGKKNNPFEGISSSDSFSEIYLVFDYDFHDITRTPEQMNEQLKYLLAFFNEETDNGKLYVNYPMLEAVAFTKELPDKDFHSYTVSRQNCRSFKALVHNFSYYPNFDFLLRGSNEEMKRNWNLILEQNVQKAKMMTEAERPNQREILDAQISKYECLDGCQVAILSAFAMLLNDWRGVRNDDNI